MAHALEFVNGNASFAGREPAWHGLGTIISDLSYEEALAEAHLADWEVRVSPLTALADGHRYEVPDAQLVLRDNPETGEAETLGVVGDRYVPIQNEAAFAIVPFLEDLGASVETAGSIRGGRQVFLSLSTGEGFVIDPDGANDRIQNYLLLSTSHDGSLAIEASSTPIRVVCANTLDFALPSAKRAYKVRHTTGAANRLAEAQAIFLSANKYLADFANLASTLYQVEVTNTEFTKIITSLYPKPEKDNKRGTTVWEKKIVLLEELFSGGGEQAYTLENVSNTAWAAVNAITERVDWYRGTRGANKDSLAIGASGFVPSVTQEKQRALDTVKAFARKKQPALFA